jgi:hypothetical protein
MYYELPEFRSDDEKPLYLAPARLKEELEETSKPEKVLKEIATSAPVKAVKNFNKKFFQLMTTSLGIVAALALNDAFRSLIEKGGPFYKTVGESGPWIIAFFMVALAYIATVVMGTVYPNESVTTKKNPVE